MSGFLRRSRDRGDGLFVVVGLLLVLLFSLGLFGLGFGRRIGDELELRLVDLDALGRSGVPQKSAPRPPYRLWLEGA